MNLRPTFRRALVLAGMVAIAASAGLSAGAPRSDAVVLGLLKTYRTAIDVDLEITERVTWKGIRPGCFAPAEDFDVTYRFDVQSQPRRTSRVTAATTTITPGIVGVTYSYGDRGGFRQFSSGGPWELQTANPGNCPAASPVPSWAGSPTCKRIAERVSASLQMEPGGRDGRLTVTRTPKARPTLRGASIGASCFRALTEIDAVGLASEIAVSERATLIVIPVRSLRAKLNALAEGSDRARPSFRLPVTISGDCTAMKMSGSIGPKPDFAKSPYPVPNRALGSPADLAKATSCSISGRGDFTVRRVGPVVETAFRP